MYWIVYSIRRIGIAFIQIIAIWILTFLILRMLPANPAYQIAGFNTSPENIHRIEVELGLNKPIWVQMWDSALSVIHGDFGQSTSTGNSVWLDLARQVPATLELVVFGIGFAVLFAVPLGIWAAQHDGGITQRIIRGYSLMAGALPDYWWGLALIFIFFVEFQVAPGPIGQLPVWVQSPPRITGSYVLDSILSGEWETLYYALLQLILPVATIVIVYTPSFLKMTIGSYRTAMTGDPVRLMRASGVSEFRISLIIFRMASPPIVTTVGIGASYLLGAAALIESVFGINGAARYAVNAAVSSDYPGMQGVVLAIATLSAVIYLVTDIVQLMLDPRLRAEQSV
jgi:ABC-type dipeptide/oligopeptide/nickel transport system permease component